LYDNRFDFDSSFIRPEAVKEFGFLATLRKAHPDSPISIFGHADPVGKEDYNKTLSGRRAEAVHALLTRDAGVWEYLYSNPVYHPELGVHSDKWGVKAVQVMLDALLYDPQSINGEMNERTRRAVTAFQRDHGLTADGEAGPQTRRQLFLGYMDFLCRDRGGQPYRLTRQDFLARGADAKGKGDYQGCGEFNPLLLFSLDEEKKFKLEKHKKERDAENAPNRRVLLYLFRPGTKIEPAQWPCPRTREGAAVCRQRFWSDVGRRLSVQAERREYAKTGDTFACRFYDRLAFTSPCEAPGRRRTWVRIVVRDAKTDDPVPEVELIVRSAAGRDFPSVTDAAGSVLVQDLEAGTVEVLSGLSAANATSLLAYVGPGPRRDDLETTGALPVRLRPVKAAEPGRRRQIAVLSSEADEQGKKKFVDIDAPAEKVVGANSTKVKPFRRAGLATEAEHEILVAPLDAFTFFLRDERDFPVPEADYEIMLADLTVERGKLDRQGRGVVWNPPDGPFEIRYLDLDDVKVKSLAGRVRKACQTGDANEVYQVLIYSPTLVEQAVAAYREYFDDLSGKG
ncbi:MAG: peptidoglycan-binding protein, partial [Pyrinomonadaceae bacterium]